MAKRVFVTSKRFYDDFTGADGGVDFAMGVVGDRLKLIMSFYVKWSKENARIQFTDGGPSDYSAIAMINPFDTLSFRDEGFQIGDTFDVVNSPSNDGSYTIADMSEDGRTIYVDATLTTESDRSANFFGTTPITALDLFYNLIRNDAVESYESLTDTDTLQKYSFADIDATDVSTIIKAVVGTKSFGWVTNPIFSEAAGNTAEVTMVGDGITDYKQAFTLTQYFLITPLWTVEELNSFENNVAPELWQDGQSLKYVYRLDAKYLSSDADYAHTSTDASGLSVFKNGVNNWFDHTIKGGRPEYSLSSIVYTQDGDIVDELDLNVDAAVVITLTSRSGRFVDQVGGPTPALGTRVELNTMLCPQDTARYIDTPSRTLRQNIFHDKADFQIGDSAVNGDQYGTDYQSIAGATVTFVDVNTITIAFSLQSSEAFKDFLKASSETDRNFVIFVTTQNLNVVTTKGADREAVLCAYGAFAYDQDDATLLDMPEGIIADEFPFEGENVSTEVAGYEGDPAFVRIPFRVQEGFYEKCSSTITFVGSATPFTWTMKINGLPSSPTTISFDPADVPASLASLEAALAIDFPGFTCTVDYVGASTTWTVVITTGNPGGQYEGLEPVVTVLGPAVTEGAFVAIETTATRPTVQSLKVEIIATKTDKTNFVLETVVIDCSGMRFVQGIQDIDVVRTRGFVAPDDAHENRLEVFRREDLDNANLRGYEMQFGTILRYEYWRQALAIYDATGIDVFKDITDVTDEWSNYNAFQDWNLKLRFTATVKGYDEHNTEFFAEVPVRVLTGDEAPDAAPFFTPVTVEYFGLNPDTELYDEEIGCVNRDGLTLVKATFTCNFAALPNSALGIYGTMRADQPVVGSVFTSRFATSERASESDSPWSAPDAPTDSPFVTYANGNLRISIYKTAGDFTSVVVEGLLSPDDFTGNNILIYPRVGFKYLTLT